LERWVHDLKIGDRGDDVVWGGSLPSYGAAIDVEVLETVKQRISLGLPMDCDILRDILLQSLQQHNMLHLLRENGGSGVYGRSWAHRFFHRHNLPCRVVTTKMREKPQDFEAVAQRFEDILAVAISDHNVPPELVINLDETNLQFVPASGKMTRALKGSKKVRSHGVGKEKAQITVTLAVTESGAVLPPQLIFGGKTPRCHPHGILPPCNGYYAHSKSHWQTPETMVEYITNILVPYRQQIITAHNLPPTQKMVVILDLHYSHKADAEGEAGIKKAVLSKFSKEFMIPVYIPAGCTDEMQVLDVCCNKPFKSAAKTQYKLWLHQCFNQHIAAGKPAETWMPEYSMKVLKPLIVGYVEKGIMALRTPAMVEAIKDCFGKHTRLTNCRNPETVLAARGRIGANIDIEQISTKLWTSIR
jgi:hypothetical protein